MKKEREKKGKQEKGKEEKRRKRKRREKKLKEKNKSRPSIGNQTFRFLELFSSIDGSFTVQMSIVYNLL